MSTHPLRRFAAAVSALFSATAAVVLFAAIALTIPNAAFAQAKPRKIVVLWASIGFGHLSASQAIEAHVKRMDPTAKVVLQDVREFQNPIRVKLSSINYDFMTKVIPSFYDHWFKSYLKKSDHVQSMSEMPLAKTYMPPALIDFLEEQQPDCIISTYMHATEGLIGAREQGRLKGVSFAQVMTDFVNARYFQRLGEQVEMSFVPHDLIRDTWLGNGFPADRVMTVGIPVNPKALTLLGNDERAAFLRSKRLDPELPTITLVSGSAGVGDFADAVKSIVAQFPTERVQIVAIAANSVANFERMAFLAPHLPPHITLRAERRVPQEELFLYMKSSALVITKSGGSSISELAAMGKPLILMDINGGQENFNSVLFDQEGMAVSVKDESSVGAAARMVYDDLELRKTMLTSQVRYANMLNPAAPAEWALRKHPTPVAKRLSCTRAFGGGQR